MPVFETRESEIEEFTINKILKNDNKEDNARASWDDKSELCMLKIYGIKTLVKSYLPVKDAHIRPGIDRLLGILRNMLLYGEISKDIQSSSVDKAHLRLASAKAILRLSRQWDQKIPVDLFHLTLRTSDISFPQVKKIFLSKVHQYIKDRLLDAKYACAFLFNIFGSKPDEFAEDKQNLADIIQMYHQAKARQLSTQSDANSLTAYPEYILPYLVHAFAHNSCPNFEECKDAEAYDNIYRELHLILSMLVHRDEDAKSEATTNKEKESISTITSIFQSIKHSEDIIDASKTKNSHVICDLGLAISKRLVQKDVDLQGLTTSASLPEMLYKTHENEKDDSVANEVTTWLADGSVLAHLESLELEMVPSKAEDNGDGDGDEMPLGKIIKHIKSQGTKGKRVKKNKFVPDETKKVENGIDILNVVREINLDNLEMSSKFEQSNGHEDSLCKKSEKDPEHTTSKKNKAGEVTPVPVPKRRRSSPSHGSLRSSSSTSKAPLRVSQDLTEAKLPLDIDISADAKSRKMRRKMVKGSDSEPIVSSLKQKAKGSDNHHNDEADESHEHDLKSPDNLKQTDKTAYSNVKSHTRPSQKRKRKSIGGLAKCTSKGGESDTEDLIGCRIKVWWPMDKQFYEGTIKSYDSLKRKHVILYDDGDVEVLRLEKERWERVDKGHKAAKKIKPLKTVSSLEVSTGLKHKISSGSQVKKSKMIVNGKQSPKKNVKRGQKGVSKNIFHEEDVKESSEISSPKETMTLKSDDLDSGNSEGEQNERFDEIMTKEKESKQKVKSTARGKRHKKEKHLSYSDQSDEEEDGERLYEERECVPHDIRKVDEESSSEEKEMDELSDSREKANGVEESHTEENQENSDGGSSSREKEKSHSESSDPDGIRDTEISDDEPLSKWKHPTGKKSSGQKR